MNHKHTRLICILTTPTQTSAHKQYISGVNICTQPSVRNATAATPKNTQAITLKSSHVAGQEKLQAGAVALQEVLDVSPGRHLVLLLRLFGAARQGFGGAHLKIRTLK